MEVPDSIRCQICGREVPAEDIFPAVGKPLSEFTVGYYQSMTYSETFPTEGKILCEDCYIDNAHRVRICDLWGERATGCTSCPGSISCDGGAASILLGDLDD